MCPLSGIFDGRARRGDARVSRPLGRAIFYYDVVGEKAGRREYEMLLSFNSRFSFLRRVIERFLLEAPTFYQHDTLLWGRSPVWTHVFRRYHDPVLPRHPTDSRTSDLFEARAILLGRLGRHDQALEMYAYRMQDYLKAEEYVALSPV